MKRFKQKTPINYCYYYPFFRFVSRFFFVTFIKSDEVYKKKFIRLSLRS